METAKKEKTKEKAKKKKKSSNLTTRKGSEKASKKNIALEVNKVELPADSLTRAMEEEAEFINETQLNEKIINQFYKFYKRKIKRTDFYTLLFCGIVLIIVGINFLLQGSDYFFGIIFNIIFNVFLIGLGIYLFIYAFDYQKFDKKESKKVYDEDISKYVNRYYFNNERVVINNKIGTTERTYECLEAVYETKEFYYILLSRNSGYVINKNSFTKGTESEFHDFIKAKMGKNYKKRCHRKNK